MASRDVAETIDTNVLLCLIFDDQPRQRDKTIRMLVDSDHTFLIPDMVFSEAIHVLTQRTNASRARIAESIYRVLSAFYNLSYDVHIVTEVFHDYVEHPALSFEDCYLAYYASKNGAAPLWTFDKKLAHSLPAAKEIK